MRLLRLSILIVITASITACAAFSPNDVANPSNVTIEKAMQSIGAGFSEMQKSLEGRKMGLWPCKVTTTLNVTANAEQGGNLVIDTTIKPPADVVTVELKEHAEQANKSSATRGNAINIEMYSAACIPKDTVGYDKPKDVSELAKALAEALKMSPLNKKLSDKEIEIFKDLSNKIQKE